MSRSFIALASIGALLVSVAAYAQTTAPAPAPAASTPAAAPAASTTPAPATGAKRTACQTTTAALKGQDKRDQMQLCMAQAHLDCLKQAIDQKITGPQRKDFVKTCAN